MSVVHITQQSIIGGAPTRLPSSKSLSNRALILQALSVKRPVVNNLSEARDTALMQKLISSSDATIDVMDAGTTMRFLTAYFAVTNQQKVMTGTPRMKERPIGLLVDALRTIGVDINYEEKEGFPPHRIHGFAQQKGKEVTVPGNVSSQYISALMMVAPALPQGLTIRLVGKIGSKPYIDMTGALMRHFGVSYEMGPDYVRIPPARYTGADYTVEADWSAASYWFAFAALAKQSSLKLPGVVSKSLQGDRAIVDIMERLGVTATFDTHGAILAKREGARELRWDFTDCPDLAQTVLPICAATGVTGDFTGLESLLIKETDRIAALQRELGKIGATLTEPSKGQWRLTPGHIDTKTKLVFDTYHDHRMAMGLAPLATLADVTINEPDVVNKSYPGFWEDMKRVGFDLTAR